MSKLIPQLIRKFNFELYVPDPAYPTAVKAYGEKAGKDIKKFVKVDDFAEGRQGGKEDGEKGAGQVKGWREGPATLKTYNHWLCGYEGLKAKVSLRE